MKTNPQQTGALLATGVDNSEVVGNTEGNNGKLAKFIFTKPKCGVEEPSSIISNARQVFT